MSNRKPVKVLYIAGSGRSGSTILTAVLGQINRFSSVGELYYLWESGLKRDELCGCGVPFSACETWVDIIDQTLSGLTVTPDEMIEVTSHSMRTRHIPLLLFPSTRERIIAQSHPYLVVLSRLYQVIQHQMSCDVIVDSSKFPSYAQILAQLPNIELFVLHIVRDSRAVAHSWQRRKHDPSTDRLFDRMNPIKSAVLWAVWNVSIEVLSRSVLKSENYLRIRYEDFVEEPKSTIEQIMGLLQFSSQVEFPFDSDNQVQINPSHIIAGNPVRFQTGKIRLCPDFAWQEKMKAHHRFLVTALTWPLLHRYGYLK